MKHILALLILLGALFFTCVTGYAQEEYTMDLNSQLGALGADELIRALPDEARQMMDETDLHSLSLQEILSLEPGAFFSGVWNMIKESAVQPFVTLGIIMGILVICTILENMKTSFAQGTMHTVFAVVCSMSIGVTVVTPIISCIKTVSVTVQNCSNFMVCYIPVFAAVLTAAGQPITGNLYHVFLFSASEVVSQVAARTLIPLLCIYLAFCLVGSASAQLNIGQIAQAVKKVVCWFLGLMLTAFVSLLTIQGVVASSADSVAIKTTKFLIGSFVPVVGSALSDAYTAARGCLQMLKTTIGGFGILIAAFTFIPILAQTTVWYLCVQAGAFVGDTLGNKTAADILRSCGATLGILLSFILCFALLIIIATTIILVIGGGGS